MSAKTMTKREFIKQTNEYIKRNWSDISEYEGTVGEYLTDLLPELNSDGADESIIKLWGKDRQSAIKALTKFYSEEYDCRPIDWAGRGINLTNQHMVQTKLGTKEYETSHALHSMEMVLYTDRPDGTLYAEIEWVSAYHDGDVDVEHIGLWFNDNKELEDFDGISFELPKKAIELIQECGFIVDTEEFGITN